MENSARQWGAPSAASFLCVECGLWRPVHERVARTLQLCWHCLDERVKARK